MRNWFKVAAPLGDMSARVLVMCSFLIPLVLWCVVSYAPFLWERDYRLTIVSAPSDTQAFPATYLAGDVVSDDYFHDYQQAIRDDNAALAEMRESSAKDFGMSERSARSYNKKILRSFVPVAEANGWFNVRIKDQLSSKDYYREMYATMFRLWGQLDSGELQVADGTLNDENLQLIKTNYQLLNQVADHYDANKFLSEPMFQLVPQGRLKVARPVYIPAPDEVFNSAWADFTNQSELGDLQVASRYRSSISVVFSGFLLAALIGVPIALLAGTFTFLSKLIEPFVDFFRYMPAPAFSTVLIAVFGLAQAPKVALVVIGTLPHLILMVANTTRTVDRSLLDAAQTLGASRLQVIKDVVIPAILPSLYNDLRILLGWAWTWLVIAELIGMKSGLTEIIDTQGRRFQFDHVYPIIFLIGLTGFFVDQILSGVRVVFFPWIVDEKSGPIAQIVRLPARFVAWLTEGRLDPEINTKAI